MMQKKTPKKPPQQKKNKYNKHTSLFSAKSDIKENIHAVFTLSIGTL